MLGGRFRLWGREARLDLSRPWVEPQLGLSWNYPVHYFDALPGIADRAAHEVGLANRVCSFIQRWIEVHPPGTAVAWDPYPTAIRIVNWLDVLAVLATRSGPDWRDRVLASIYVQAAWLRHRLERHLLGTHLLKDAKGLLLAGTTFTDGAACAWVREAEGLLRRELHVQVGPDGAHLEPSVMYHCIALEDVLDLLNFASAATANLREDLEAAALRMLPYARAVQTPAGGYPLLGDAWEGGAPAPAELLDYAERLGLASGGESVGLRFFADAGVVAWRDARTYLVADVGGVGPPHLSGHGHCDSLSFECWIDGRPFVVDSGTWSYEPGELRHGCRATRAHNTLELDGGEQHEIWASFRVGRRSAVRAAKRSETALEARLVPWQDKRACVQRRFEFEAGSIGIHDRVEGPGRHQVTSRLHLHPGCEIVPEPGRVVVRHGEAAAEFVWASPAHPESGAPAASFRILRPADSGSLYAERAGETRPNAVIEVAHAGELPFESVLRIRPLGPR